MQLDGFDNFGFKGEVNDHGSTQSGQHPSLQFKVTFQSINQFVVLVFREKYSQNATK